MGPTRSRASTTCSACWGDGPTDALDRKRHVATLEQVDVSPAGPVRTRTDRRQRIPNVVRLLDRPLLLVALGAGNGHDPDLALLNEVGMFHQRCAFEELDDRHFRVSNAVEELVYARLGCSDQFRKMVPQRHAFDGVADGIQVEVGPVVLVGRVRHICTVSKTMQNPSLP